MRQVHDIINFILPRPLVVTEDTPKGPLAFPVAFIQWGNTEEGYQYEVICPWCAKSIGWVQPAIDGHFDEVKKQMAIAMARHYQNRTLDCARFGASTFDVTRATAPLGTEKLPTIQ